MDPVAEHLLVVDPRSGAHELVGLARPPEDPTAFADLVGVLGGERVVEPAGPPLRGPGGVLHRVRGAVTGTSTAVPDELRSLVADAVEQERGGDVPVLRSAWCRAGWAAETAAWVDQVLTDRGGRRTGRSTVVKSWGLSHVERIPTSEGALYLKASSALFRHEPATTGWLAGVAPGVVPTVVAQDEQRACLLLRPLPPVDESLTDEQVWVPTAVSMAELHLATAGRGDELRATGAPERGLTATARDLTEVVRAGLEIDELDGPRRRVLRQSLDRVLGGLEDLAACGLPETLVHGDLHPANVVVDGDRAVVFDWSDACVGHPLLDLVHLCAHRPRTGAPELTWEAPWVQAYLRPWRTGCTESTLRRALALADVADLAFQAVTYERIQGSLEPAARQDLEGAQVRTLRWLVERFRPR